MVRRQIYPHSLFQTITMTTYPETPTKDVINIETIANILQQYPVNRVLQDCDKTKIDETTSRFSVGFHCEYGVETSKDFIIFEVKVEKSDESPYRIQLKLLYGNKLIFAKIHDHLTQSLRVQNIWDSRSAYITVAEGVPEDLCDDIADYLFDCDEMQEICKYIHPDVKYAVVSSKNYSR